MKSYFLESGREPKKRYVRELIDSSQGHDPRTLCSQNISTPWNYYPLSFLLLYHFPGPHLSSSSHIKLHLPAPNWLLTAFIYPKFFPFLYFQYFTWLWLELHLPAACKHAIPAYFFTNCLLPLQPPALWSHVLLCFEMLILWTTLYIHTSLHITGSACMGSTDNSSAIFRKQSHIIINIIVIIQLLYNSYILLLSL